MESNSKQPQGALQFPDRGIIWKKSHNPHRGTRLLKSKSKKEMFNFKAKMLDIFQLISVASHGTFSCQIRGASPSQTKHNFCLQTFPHLSKMSRGRRRSNLPEFLISIKLSTQQHNPIISPFLSPSPQTLLYSKPKISISFHALYFRVQQLSHLWRVAQIRITVFWTRP